MKGKESHRSHLLSQEGSVGVESRGREEEGTCRGRVEATSYYPDHCRVEEMRL